MSAAVEKSEDLTRQRPDRFFGHRKPGKSEVTAAEKCGNDMLLFHCDRICTPEGEAVVNDSPGDCQSRRADRSIFSAEKMQDRRFKSLYHNEDISLSLIFFCAGLDSFIII